MAPPAEPPFQVEIVDNLAIVRITQERIDDQELVEAFGQRVLELVEQDGQRRLIFDFAHVDMAMSYMLGKLITLNRNIQKVGGQLAICHVRGSLAKAFSLTSLKRALEIFETLEQARDHLTSNPASS